MKSLTLSTFTILITTLLSTLSAAIPLSAKRGDALRNPDHYKNLRVRVSPEIDGKHTLRVPWTEVSNFPDPYGDGFSQRMVVLSTDYHFKQRQFVSSAAIPLDATNRATINAAFANSDVVCIFYVDRPGVYGVSTSGKSSGDGETVRDWIPLGEPFELQGEATPRAEADGLRCWYWPSARSWKRMVRGSVELWDAYVHEQIYNGDEDSFDYDYM